MPQLNSKPIRGRFHAGLRPTKARFAKLLVLLRSRHYRRALWSGVAASVEHRQVPFRDDIVTVIDIGASRGQFAIFAARRFPKARIMSFEPLPGPREQLERVLGSRVEVNTVALGANSGSVDMNISAQDDSSSVLKIGAAQKRNFPGTDAVGSLTVPMMTLDEAIGPAVERPCLLKIDVQGLELEVLKGARDVLPQVDEALIECSFIELYEGQALADEVIRFALESGLRLIGMHGLVRTADGESVQADLHFRRPEVT